MSKASLKVSFTPYQKLVIVLLSLVQFTVVLDFMVMAPLGDLMMKSMGLTAPQFASAVSGYAFSAGISGLLAAGFADRFDRKKLLLFFYCGFMLGTLLCGLSSTHAWLLFGRIVTGLFGGVMGSISLAIVSDLFSFEQRGRVMGFVQMAFAVSQIAGIPIGLLLANKMGWQAPFFMIVVLSAITTFVVTKWMRPVALHMEAKTHVSPFVHLTKTISRKEYRLPFIATALLSIGGFMMMPFSTPYLINNIRISQRDLPLIYVVTGLGSMVMLPAIGKLSDRIGKFPTFLVGTIIALVMVLVWTHIDPVPVWEIIIINTLMFAGIMSRMIPSSALMTAVPDLAERGSFMSVNSSLQQVAGGVASIVAGLIIVQSANGHIYNFDILGYTVIGVMLICVWLIWLISKRVAHKLGNQPAGTETA